MNSDNSMISAYIFLAEFANKNLVLTTRGKSIDYYSVAGASKRGWTTWLVGAVDYQRVVAIIPIVLDAINFVAVEKHQWRSYGGWASALKVICGFLIDYDTSSI